MHILEKRTDRRRENNMKSFFMVQPSDDNYDYLVDLKNRFSHLKKYDQPIKEKGQNNEIRQMQHFIDKHVATNTF